MATIVLTKKCRLCLMYFLITSYGYGQELSRFEFKAQKMGTIFNLVLYAADAQKANQASNLAFEKVDTLNQIFSDYAADSEINTLVKRKFQKISPSLTEVLAFALYVSKATDGAFDVTIGPLSKLWRRAFRRGEFPDNNDLLKAKSEVGYQNIRLKPKKGKLRLNREGVQLDFGAIVKGYAADQMGKILRENGISSFLADAGGDILVGAPPPDSPGWKIELPDGTFTYLQKSAIAVSGDTYKYLDWGGKRFSHIIDPRTGFGVTHRTIVAVFAKDGMAADAWASAISVTGKNIDPFKVTLQKEAIEVRFFNSVK